VTFEYDYMNRRVRKQVFAWNGTSWNTTPDEDWRFVYDVWNVVEVLDGKADNAVKAKYTWGLDLSGLAGATEPRAPASGPGIHGAGGTLDTLGERQRQVGGLLAREEPQAVGDPKRHWYLYDANGNVGQLLEYVAGSPPTVTLAAHYEYDPYGSIIRRDDVDSSGVVDANPYRFSTKYSDPETGQYAYIFRIYDPRLGRWLSRDPLREKGGRNLYAFLRNRSPNKVDTLGMQATGGYDDGDVDIEWPPREDGDVDLDLCVIVPEFCQFGRCRAPYCPPEDEGDGDVDLGHDDDFGHFQACTKRPCPGPTKFIKDECSCPFTLNLISCAHRVAQSVFDSANAQGKGHCDKWMHCVSTCRIGNECIFGWALALPGGAVKEIGDIKDRCRKDSGVWMDSFGDLLHNSAGWAMSFGCAIEGNTGRCCERECWKVGCN